MPNDFNDLAQEVRRRPGAAERIEEHKKAMRAALALAELRKQRGKTQVDVARKLDVSQVSISQMEHSVNPQMGTLSGYVGALGGRLEVNAVFDDGEVVPIVLDDAREPETA